MIDINKKYRTRDGREVRIYATDCGREKNMVHGAIKNKSGWWEQCSWYKDGRFYDGPHSHELDLIAVRPRHKRTVWLHVFKNSTVCATEEPAYNVTNRLACIKVALDFEEGEGL